MIKHNSFDCIGEMYFALCKEVNTPISLSSWLRFKYSHRELLAQELPIGDYLEWESDRFKGDYAVVSALAKYKGLDTGYNLESVALEKFATSELVCKETNKRLRSERLAPTDGVISARLYCAKKKIARLLGPFSLHCISAHFGWGPGATHDIPRARALVDAKLTTVPITVGGPAKELLQSEIALDLHWSSALLGSIPEGPWCFMPHVFERTDTCRVTTVPKSAKTDRTIAIEPTGNLFLQKGVGGYLRRKLRCVGIDLDDQEVNQVLAKEAIDKDLATLDLRAASDTVSRELVYELLPLDWALLLDALRSPSALLPDGSVVKLEKFSSMGNGFTFELESLIFWALGSSVSDEVAPGGVLSIYGDDIICQKAAATEIVRTLRFVGFETNAEKSFVEGLFYESCGKHYFNGQNVTPFYQKETLESLPEFIRLHNRVVRWSERVALETKAHLPVLRAAPEELRRCRLPFGVEGDDGFLSSIEDMIAFSRGFDRNFGFRSRVVKRVTRSLPGHEQALLALHLRSSSRRVHFPNPLDGWMEDDHPLAYLVEGSYGDVAVDVHGRKPITEESIQFGWRWIVPPGYCLLPRR